jgi:membrane protein DedA with SNARE-associated domain/rhodanese-related sulfurtransferase
MGWAAFLAAHGYISVATILFISAMGLPAPVSLALMLGGSAAHGGSLRLEYLLPLAILSENLGASILFLGGRKTGWWLLGRLCRVTMDPENCIFRSAGFFYERGPRVLLFARFIPGLNSMAPPLAGSLNMKPFRFWRLDILGATLHASTWTLVGYFLSRYIRAVTNALAVVGHVALGFVLLVVVGYAAMWLFVLIRDRRYRNVARVSAEEVVLRLENPDPSHPIVIADVRSHGYYDPGMQRIKNSIRVEPNRLGVELDALRETLAPECEIYVYCSCVRDATSIRIAHAMSQRGTAVKVIDGGLRGWLRSGCPTEPVPAGELRHLPRFE